LHELLSAAGDDWSETTLGEVAKWGSGGTPKSGESAYYDGDIPWCVIGDLNEGEVFLTEKCITSEGLKNSSAKIIEPGAVMIAMYGASIGRTGIVGRPMATNQAIAFAYPIVGTLDNRFLLLFLQAQKLQFVEAGQGAAQPNISQTVLKAWPMILPPLNEQERIVGIVSSMDDVIQTAEQTMVDAKNLRAGLLSDLLSGNHEIPASYDSMLGAA
jgi:type I restriction enzyme S subunit